METTIMGLYRVWGLVFRVSSWWSDLKVQESGFGAWGLKFKVFGFGVSGFCLAHGCHAHPG